jgi:hypothetical protein
MSTSHAVVQQHNDGAVIAVKVVPGASRSQVVGRLGAALKVKVAAPPEAGKANKAVCELLAAVLGISAKSTSVESGHSNPNKRIAVKGMTAAQVLDALQEWL